jgi:hypothetical protein
MFRALVHGRAYGWCEGVALDIWVFAGPTLPPGHPARDGFDAHFVGPAAQGDVYMAARRQPWGIVIIDGYFERVPAVWHKEILWAMARGVHVFGGGSIGALRAVELQPFGMVGVGTVFEAYRSGELEGDDEVALIHAPADASYRPLSEALVNVRWTVAAAKRHGILSDSTRAALIGLAQDMFYAERTYSALLRTAAEAGLPPHELDSLADWLPSNRADQKQADAIELLSHVRAVRQAQPGPKQVSFAFRHTDAFDQLRRHTGDRLAEPGAAEAEIEPVLDELRLRGDRSYRRARQQALVRALALWILEAEGITVDAEALSLQVERFRRQHRLASGDDIASWLEGAGLGIDDLSRLLSDEARIDRVLSLVAGDLPLRLVEHLRLAGVYRTLCQRALDKRACLADHGCKQPTLADAGINEEQLLAWYFGTRLGSAPPSDLEVYARLLDLADVDHLRRLLLAEYCYRRLDGSLGEGR